MTFKMDETLVKRVPVNPPVRKYQISFIILYSQLQEIPHNITYYRC